MLTPVDEAGRFYDDFGWLHGLGTAEAADQIVADLAERGRLVEAGTIRAPLPVLLALPHAAHLPHLRRLVHRGRRAPPSRSSTRTRRSTWTPEYMGKRMDDWLRNMGDWNISRRRYYGLPLPFYPCACGHLNVIGSRGELEERARRRARPARGAAPPVDRRGADPLRGVRRARSSAIPEVGDVWLDAGIVPFSTLGWQNPEWVEQGYATGAATGLTTADLPDHAYWEEWFPADWVSEMREQIRLWFYSQLFMSVALVGPRAVPAGARLREDARRARPRDARLLGEHDRRPRTRSPAWART